MNRAFLDEAVPALEGRTPREAVKDPRLRPVLILLMKDRVRSCDERNLATGGDEDINWMLVELGLDEILSDPPPRRKAPAIDVRAGASEDAEDETEDPFGEDGVVVMDPSLPAAPSLPDRPFTLQEVAARMQAGLNSGGSVGELLERLDKSGCTLIDDVRLATRGFLNADAMALLVPLLLMAWHVFVPPGTRGSNISVGGLKQAIQEGMDPLQQEFGSPQHPGEEARSWLKSGPQPAAAAELIGSAQRMIASEIGSTRKLESQTANILIVIRAVLVELDFENRED